MAPGTCRIHAPVPLGSPKSLRDASGNSQNAHSKHAFALSSYATQAMLSCCITAPHVFVRALGTHAAAIRLLHGTQQPCLPCTTPMHA
eukprot:6206866-Pleurochrysis_carterae.AAC.2